MYYDIGAYDKKNDQFKEMCHKAWSERFNYLCIDMTKNKDKDKYRFFNGSKTTYIDCIPESEHFKKNIQILLNVHLSKYKSRSHFL